jgi:hypothetical protein
MLLYGLVGSTASSPQIATAAFHEQVATPEVTSSNTSDVTFEVMGHLDALASHEFGTIAISGTQAYIGEAIRDEATGYITATLLTIVDVSNPISPTIQGSLPIPSGYVADIECDL